MEIDCFLSLVSPYTYMGHERFLQIAARGGATVNFKPTDRGKVFPVSGGLPLAKRSPRRRACRMMEPKRRRGLLGVPLTLEPRFFPGRDEAAGHRGRRLNRAGAAEPKGGRKASTWKLK